MTCLYCGGKTKVVESRNSVEEVIRRRKCLECGKLLYTAERDIDYKEGAKLLYEYSLRNKNKKHSS